MLPFKKKKHDSCFVKLPPVRKARGFARTRAFSASGPQELTNQDGPAPMTWRQKENATSNTKIVH